MAGLALVEADADALAGADVADDAGADGGSVGVGVGVADGGGGGGALGRKSLPTAFALCTGTCNPTTLPLLWKVKFTKTDSPCSSGATSPRSKMVMCALPGVLAVAAGICVEPTG